MPILLSLSGSALPHQFLPQTLLDRLADANLAYVLLIVGFLGLFLELSAPGTMIPGVVGAVSLVLAAAALSALPFQWRGALLIGLAFILFVTDLFVPSLGLLTLGGFAALVVGSYLLFDESGSVVIDRPLIWAVTALLVILFVLIGFSALSVFRRKPETGREGLVGAVGTVRQSLDPDGMVFVAGELWQATATSAGDSPTAPIEPSVPVTVTGMDGLRLFVRRATAAEAAAAGVAVIGDVRPAPPRDALPVAPDAS